MPNTELLPTAPDTNIQQQVTTDTTPKPDSPKRPLPAAVKTRERTCESRSSLLSVRKEPHFILVAERNEHEISLSSDLPCQRR